MIEFITVRYGFGNLLFAIYTKMHSRPKTTFELFQMDGLELDPFCHWDFTLAGASCASWTSLSCSESDSFPIVFSSFHFLVDAIEASLTNAISNILGVFMTNRIILSTCRGSGKIVVWFNSLRIWLFLSRVCVFVCVFVSSGGSCWFITFIPSSCIHFNRIRYDYTKFEASVFLYYQYDDSDSVQPAYSVLLPHMWICPSASQTKNKWVQAELKG